MTARLAMKLFKQSLDAPVSNAAVVSIRQIGDAQGRLPDEPFETDVSIPAGPTPSVVVDVPEGRFSLTARAPGGATDRRTVRTVLGEVQAVTFDTGRSGREWLSWSTLAGVVPTAPAFNAERRRPRGGLAFLPPPSLALTRGLPPVFALDGSDRASLHRNIFGARGHVGYETVAAGRGPPLALRASAAERTIFCWSLSEPGRYPRGEVGGGDRRFAVLEYPDGITLAMLPAPWPYRSFAPAHGDVGGGVSEGHAAIDLIADRTLPPNRAVRLTLREPEFVALLGYLGAGLMSEAAAALGPAGIDAHVTRLIREKIENPLAAAGAAYVGLAMTGDEDLRATWEPWLHNLMTWFPELPDGAILYARDRIERGRTREALLRAKDALMVAYHRGVPLYAAGFQHLLSGLQLFGDDPEDPYFDPEARRMRDRVAQVAAHADPTQPFTVLTFRERLS